MKKFQTIEDDDEADTFDDDVDEMLGDDEDWE